MQFRCSAYKLASILITLQVYIESNRDITIHGEDLEVPQSAGLDGHVPLFSQQDVPISSGTVNATHWINATDKHSSLVQHEVVTSAVLILAASIYKVAETVTTALPEIMLTLFSADLMFHSQSLTFWDSARNVCGGAVNWMDWNTWSNLWTATEKQVERREIFEKKMDLVDTHIQEMCNKVSQIPKEFWTAVHAICTKASNCGSISEFALDGVFQDLGSLVFGLIVEGEAVIDEKCKSLYEPSKIALDVCKIDVSDAPCELFSTLDEMGMSAALEKMNVDVQKAEKMIEKSALASKVGYHTVTTVMNPMGKLAYLLTEASGLDQYVKDLILKQAKASTEVMAVDLFGTEEEIDNTCAGLEQIEPVKSLFQSTFPSKTHERP